VDFIARHASQLLELNSPLSDDSPPLPFALLTQLRTLTLRSYNVPSSSAFLNLVPSGCQLNIEIARAAAHVIADPAFSPFITSAVPFSLIRRPQTPESLRALVQQYPRLVSLHVSLAEGASPWEQQAVHSALSQHVGHLTSLNLFAFSVHSETLLPLLTHLQQLSLSATSLQDTLLPVPVTGVVYPRLTSLFLRSFVSNVEQLRAWLIASPRLVKLDLDWADWQTVASPVQLLRLAQEYGVQEMRLSDPSAAAWMRNDVRVAKRRTPRLCWIELLKE
jgi:hypothetical protein